jgi:hypothetical protein
LHGIQRKFDKAAGFTQRERFWSATAACALTSGIIAKKLGLHDIDVSAVYKWAVETLSSMRIEVRADGMTPLSRIGMFLNEKNNNMLIVNSKVDKRSGLTEAPIREPRGELMTRFEPDTEDAVTSLQRRCESGVARIKSLIRRCVLTLEKNKITTGVIKKSHVQRVLILTTPSVFALVIDCAVATDL